MRRSTPTSAATGPPRSSHGVGSIRSGTSSASTIRNRASSPVSTRPAAHVTLHTSNTDRTRVVSGAARSRRGAPERPTSSERPAPKRARGGKGLVGSRGHLRLDIVTPAAMSHRRRLPRTEPGRPADVARLLGIVTVLLVLAVASWVSLASPVSHRALHAGADPLAAPSPASDVALWATPLGNPALSRPDEGRQRFGQILVVAHPVTDGARDGAIHAAAALAALILLRLLSRRGQPVRAPPRLSHLDVRCAPAPRETSARLKRPRLDAAPVDATEVGPVSDDRPRRVGDGSPIASLSPVWCWSCVQYLGVRHASQSPRPYRDGAATAVASITRCHRRPCPRHPDRRRVRAARTASRPVASGGPDRASR